MVEKITKLFTFAEGEGPVARISKFLSGIFGTGGAMSKLFGAIMKPFQIVSGWAKVIPGVKPLLDMLKAAGGSLGGFLGTGRGLMHLLTPLIGLPYVWSGVHGFDHFGPL